MRNPTPPLLLIDWWNGSYLKHLNTLRTGSPLDRKTEVMIHGLGIRIYPGAGDPISPAAGWTMPSDRSAAVWDKGFKEFLGLREVLGFL